MNWKHSAESPSCFLKRDVFEGGVSFISFQFWMYEVPVLALPGPHAWLSPCLRAMEPGCGGRGFAQHLSCAGTQILLGASKRTRDLTALRQGGVSSRVCSWNCSLALPSVKESAIRKRHGWKSPYLALCFFSWPCVRLDSRTCGEMSFFSFFYFKLPSAFRGFQLYARDPPGLLSSYWSIIIIGS